MTLLAMQGIVSAAALYHLRCCRLKDKTGLGERTIAQYVSISKLPDEVKDATATVAVDSNVLEAVATKLKDKPVEQQHAAVTYGCMQPLLAKKYMEGHLACPPGGHIKLNVAKGKKGFQTTPANARSIATFLSKDGRLEQ